MATDRETYLAENALAEVEKRDKKISRLKKEVTRLTHGRAQHQRLIRKLRQQLIEAGIKPEN